jgi:hypothetical protein
MVNESGGPVTKQAGQAGLVYGMCERESRLLDAQGRGAGKQSCGDVVDEMNLRVPARWMI